MVVSGRLEALFRRLTRSDAGMRRMLLAIFVVLATFSAALVGGVMQATRTADAAIRADEQRLLKNYITVTTDWLLSTEGVQLTWDDAMRAVGGQGEAPDLAWADTYIGEFLTSVAGTDDLFLVSPSGAVLRAWRAGRPIGTESYAPVAAEVRRTLTRLAQNRSVSSPPASFRQLADTHWPVDARGKPLARWEGRVVGYRGEAAIMTVISLRPDSDPALLKRTPNHLVSLSRLDGALLARIGRATLLDDLRFSAAPPRDASRNVLFLDDSQGQALGWLTWRPRAVGPVLLVKTMPLLVGYLLCFCVVLALGGLIVRKTMLIARKLAASEARAQHNALHDPLLGLPNRTHVMQRLTAMLSAPDIGSDQVVLAYFDLDRFKAINENVGHHVGDDVLVQVVGRLRQMLQPGDVLGRLASDEFVVVRRGTDGQAAADELGRQIMALFAEPFNVFGQSVPVTASCGISWAPEQAAEAKAVLGNADVALFQAKARGRARYRRFTAEMDATIRWRRDMESELRRAISCNHLSMVYQPIVNVSEGSIASFEALLRWHHPERGEISPATFVPVAEAAGLMPELGSWVLRRVFVDSHDFGGAEVSINLSPLQLVARDFMRDLRVLIAEERVDPSQFTFEITEGVLLDRSDRVMGLLNELQDMGFRLALDDFGTGYSSLAYLRAFPFDRIKVDRSFVQGIENDVDAQSILRAIVALGRTLRMKVVAEGVETLTQQHLVHAAGCQYIQGYLFWRALTPEQVIALLATDTVPSRRLAV